MTENQFNENVFRLHAVQRASQLIGKTRPEKPIRSSEAISRRPIVGFSEAPMTAIDFGRNSASSRMLIAPGKARRPRPPYGECYGAAASATSAAADLLNSRVRGAHA
jgi:hypothetical protein